MKEVLVFKIGKENFAFDVSGVKEITPIESISPVPNSPEYILGIANIRGEIHSVVDLAERLEIEVPEDSEIMYIISENLLCFKIGKVDRILKIENNIELEDVPEICKTEYISKIIKTSEELIQLIDIAKLVKDFKEVVAA